MSTIKINELATSGISLTDFLVKADANGYATKNTMQGLQDFLSTLGDTSFKGTISAGTYATKDAGWYFASNTGNYIMGSTTIAVDVSDTLTIIIVPSVINDSSKVEIPITVTTSPTPTENGTDAFSTGGAFNQIKILEDKIEIKGLTLVSSFSTRVDSGIQLSGAYTPSSNTDILKYEVVEGDKVKVIGSSADATDKALYAFYPADSYANPIEVGQAMTVSETVYNLTLTVPAGATILYLAKNDNFDIAVYKEFDTVPKSNSVALVESNGIFNADVEIKDKLLIPKETSRVRIDGGIKFADGAFNPTSTSDVRIYEVVEGKKYAIIGDTKADSTGFALYGIYPADSYASPVDYGIELTTASTKYYKEITIPSGGNFFYLSKYDGLEIFLKEVSTIEDVSNDIIDIDKNNSILQPVEIFEINQSLSTAGNTKVSDSNYTINKYRVKGNTKYRIKGDITTLSTQCAFGLYRSETNITLLEKVFKQDAGNKDYDLIITTTADSTHLMINQEDTDLIDVYEVIDALKVNQSNRGYNLIKNYRLENIIGVTPTVGDTTTPLDYFLFLSNSTNLGYQNALTNYDFGSYKFTLGADGINSGYILFGLDLKDRVILNDLKGKEVVFSFFVKHELTTGGVYLQRVIDGVVTNTTSAKKDIRKIDEFYRVDYTFTMPSTTPDTFLVTAYIEQSAGNTEDIELKKFAFYKKSDNNLKEFPLNYSYEVERKNNENITNGVQFFLPKQIPVVKENKLELFNQSMIRQSIDNNFWVDFDFTGSIPDCYFYDRKFEYTAGASDTNFDVIFRLRNNNFRQIALPQNVEIIPTTKKSSPASNKNVLLIGDSFFERAVMIDELRRRLVLSGGLPVADGLTNLTFVGNKTTAGGTKHEGYSGESWEFFVGASSPFYFGGQIDFDAYCADLGISQLDYVVINLGTNSKSGNTVIAQIYDKLIAHNSNIKIIQNGCVFANPYGSNQLASTKQNYMSLIKDVINYNSRIEKFIIDDYSSNIFYNDTNVQTDILLNSVTTQVDANNRNTAQITQTNENVHLADSGELQISDAMYHSFHHFCLI